MSTYSDRKNIPVGADEFETLKAGKEDANMTWGAYLLYLKEQAESEGLKETDLNEAVERIEDGADALMYMALAFSSNVGMGDEVPDELELDHDRMVSLVETLVEFDHKTNR